MKISKILSAVIIGLGLNGSLYANFVYDPINDPKNSNKYMQDFNELVNNSICLAGCDKTEEQRANEINEFNKFPTINAEQIKNQIDKYTDSIANNPTYSDLKALGEALINYQYAKDNPTDIRGWAYGGNVYQMGKFLFIEFLKDPNINLGVDVSQYSNLSGGYVGVVERLQEIFANAIKELEALEKSSINNTIEALRRNTNINSIISLSKNALDARAIALLNPNNSSNIALAAAIKNLEGLEFASCDNDQALACVVQEYTKRFETTNNLWANVLGAKAYLKNSPDTDIYGFILGYDHAFDSDILGAFISFAKAKSDGNNITNESDNYQFGIYSKSFFGNSELDSKIYYGFSKSDYSRSVLNRVYSADYDSDFMGIELEYGYVFDINSLFVKPLVGLGYSYIRTNDFNERGDLTLHYNKTTNKNAMAKIGVELRKYYDEYSYFYIKPAIERDIYKSGTDSVANFIGSEYSIINQNDEKKHTYISGSLGAEVSLNEAFSINANIGAKLRSDEKIYNGTFGVKYKF